MSTKHSIKAGPGFHIYQETFDSPGPDGGLPVYMEIYDLIEMFAGASAGGKSVRVKLRRDFAVAIGITTEEESKAEWHYDV